VLPLVLAEFNVFIVLRFLCLIHLLMLLHIVRIVKIGKLKNYFLKIFF